MPTKRILLTLKDVKELVSKKYKVSIERIEISDLDELQFIDTELKVDDNTYILQIDFEGEE